MPNLVIDKPGIYCLAENIVIDEDFGFSAIRIEANDVVIDFRGYSITASGAGSNVIYATNRNNLTLLNGSIQATQSLQVISIIECQNVELADLNVGPSLRGTPFLISNSSEVTLRSCSAHDSPTQSFLFFNSKNCIVKDCQAYRIGSPDTDLFGAFEIQFFSKNIIFSNCVSNDNLGSGFLANFDTNSLVFLNCHARNNTLSGFQINSPNTLLSSCSALYNTTDGFALNESQIQLIGSTALNNGRVGIAKNPLLISHVFNNISAGNSSGNYAGVTAATLIAPGSVDTNTGYWSNING
jgi:hypothetical protein